MKTFLLLAQDTGGNTWLVPGLIGLIFGAVAFVILSRVLGMQVLSQSRRQAQDLVDKARSEAQTIKKQAELDGMNDLAKRRESFESELNEQRNEIKEIERRLTKREDNLDRKLDTLTTKEKYLDDLDAGIKKREAQLAGKQEELDALIAERRDLLENSRQEQKQTLLRLANLSEEDAKRESLKAVEPRVSARGGPADPEDHRAGGRGSQGYRPEDHTPGDPALCVRAHRRLDRQRDRDPKRRHEGPGHRA